MPRISDELFGSKLYDNAIHFSFYSKQAFQTYLAKPKKNNVGISFRAFWCLWRNYNDVGKERDQLVAEVKALEKQLKEQGCIAVKRDPHTVAENATQKKKIKELWDV